MSIRSIITAIISFFKKPKQSTTSISGVLPTSISGILPISNGGTGQTIKQPTFNEDFSTLDPNKWQKSSWSAPQGGMFSEDNVSIINGMLCLKLTQNSDGQIKSVGGEITSIEKFGYGTYEFEVKASSNSNDPSVSGSAVSGSITGCFNYATASITEIDVEVEGCERSNLAQFTSWVGETKPSEQTQIPISPMPHAGFRKYKYIWTPTSITFFVDGVQVAKHSTVIPSTPAPFMFNHWGTNNPNWGGTATVGVDRYMWVKSFSFTPL